MSNNTPEVHKSGVINSSLFIVFTYIFSLKVQQPKCVLTDKYIMKMWYKINITGKRVEIENSILSDIIQTQKENTT